MLRYVGNWISRVLPNRPCQSKRMGRHRLQAEPLEDRLTPAATLAPSLFGGDLVITDMDATGRNNNLTVVVSGTNIAITDAAEQFSDAGGIPGALLSNGYQTITVPFASMSGNLVINSAAGDDSLTVDFSGGSFNKSISYNGGTG